MLHLKYRYGRFQLETGSSSCVSWNSIGSNLTEQWNIALALVKLDYWKPDLNEIKKWWESFALGFVSEG